MILTGEQAKEYFNSEDKSEGFCGYFRESQGVGYWIAFDNMTGDFWTEEFLNKSDAISYVNGE